MKELNLAVDAGAITTQVIDPPAFDARSFTPHASLVLPVAGLGGLLLGSLVALLRESADPRVVSPHGARVLLGVPVLGTVPPSSSGRSLETFGWAIHADAAGQVAESLRTVRTSLQFAMSDPPARRVCVTSADQMDGKSTLASNLAIALAKSGRNVLLVDANLREPVQHRIFGVSDAVGLVDILAAGELNERAVRRTTIEHLHVLPAGQVGPASPASASGAANPSELLNSGAFTDTLDRLAERYDVILVDTPASGVVDDARIVAAACDGAVLILRAGKTNRRSAVAARDGLLSVGCRVLGTVVNAYRGASVGVLGGAGSGLGPVRYHRPPGKTGKLGQPGGFADDLDESIHSAE
jgi:capsular exopolysaccharide synthesis family protein